ncbi:MAG: ABC transporter ATP-binding protein [Gemmatimonadaceae bacterium]|nr:ABC transporter ATP-binding protein [Chitinophagaceae bacterium]
MMAVVKVFNLNKEFGVLKVVDDLTFSVNASDIYGFLGQNGAGKSTTIRMLLTLVTPTSGQIEIFGYDLFSHRRDVLMQVGAVVERPDLYKYLSAYENLSLFARMSGVRPTRKLLMDQLEMVGLADRAESRVKTYSQGMKQRLGIAVALVHNPQLIILDEPTNGLDPQGIADMRNLILHLSHNLKKTVIVSSHLLSEIEQVATRMLIIDKGRKMVEGSADELFDPAKTILSVTFADITVAIHQVETSHWKSSIKSVGENEIVFELHRDQVPRLNRELINMNLEVLSLQPKTSLEDYFLSLTGNKQHVAAFKN